MLILSRKSGESLRIGESVEVKVLEVAGGRVKFGFSAPPAVAIQRKEICDDFRPLAPWAQPPTLSELCAF